MDVAAGLDQDTCREYHIPTYQGVWKKLHDPTMARSHVVTCWRIMHGALPVNAFRLRVNGNLPAEEGCCGHPACQLDEEVLGDAFTAGTHLSKCTIPQGCDAFTALAAPRRISADWVHALSRTH